jgi:hypothetical protein
MKRLAPKTWKYLSKHGELLDSRSSLIYRNRPRFSIFGVGEYSFANWKVAISGLYKKLVFNVIGPLKGKPIVLDDTCYFLPVNSKEEALFLSKLLNSDVAKEFLGTLIFWDAKRPITLNALKQLDVLKLAHEMNADEELRKFLTEDQLSMGELPLFSKKAV